jgi:hypothetical protein
MRRSSLWLSVSLSIGSTRESVEDIALAYP